MKYTYDFDAASHVTVGTVGKPGQRTFYVQARQGRELLSFIAEKEQVRALSQALDRLSEEIISNHPLISHSDDEVFVRDMSLAEPLEPVFRIVQMGLGYDAEHDQCVLILQGLEDDDDEAPTARICFARDHMHGLSRHADQTVAGGRKLCGNCGRPMDPEGHFCPQMN